MMANIMINEVCNQKCPYCFASEFVNTSSIEMTFENFKLASSFILSDTQNFGKVGIIGGEPLLHSKIDAFIKYLVNKPEIKRVTIFTNGVLLQEHIDSILNEKIGLLINLNSPKDVGMSNFSRTLSAIDLILNKHKKKEVTFGLNIYAEKDYSFFIDLAEKYNMKRVRLSVVVPAYGTKKTGLRHFANLKATVINVCKALLLRDIYFRFDCNLPVPCMWDEQELNYLQLLGLSTYSRELIPLEQSFCTPVIDIRPDLTAIRCFGMSDISKVSILNFETMDELRKYYVEHFDSIYSKKPIDDKCNHCKLFPARCYGGCLANRVKI